MLEPLYAEFDYDWEADPRIDAAQADANWCHLVWADLAQDELNRGFGCQRNEWHHDPRYQERAKLVPKY